MSLEFPGIHSLRIQVTTKDFESWIHNWTTYTFKHDDFFFCGGEGALGIVPPSPPPPPVTPLWWSQVFCLNTFVHKSYQVIGQRIALFSHLGEKWRLEAVWMWTILLAILDLYFRKAAVSLKMKVWVSYGAPHLEKELWILFDDMSPGALLEECFKSVKLRWAVLPPTGFFQLLLFFFPPSYSTIKTIVITFYPCFLQWNTTNVPDGF